MILSFLYNTPEFFAYYLESYEIDGYAYFHATHTGLRSTWLYYVYDEYVYGVVVTSIPFLILLYVTVNILVVLHKRKNIRRSLHSSHTNNNNISTILITIVIIFMICQFPYLLSLIVRRIPSVDSSCGSFMYYLHSLPHVGCLLNSSVNGLIYFSLNKHFQSALYSHCHLCRNDRHMMVEMGRVEQNLERVNSDV